MTYRFYPFMLIAIVLLSCAQMASARTYAVCVGLSDYPGTVNDLNVSDNDARAMQQLLKANDPQTEVVLLTNRQATLRGVREAMSRCFSKAGPNDDIVFFFSGHGLKGCFVCYDGMLTYSSVFTILGRSRARSKRVYADACYSGDIRQQRGKANSRTPKNVMFFLSSRSNEKSQEWFGHRNSKFTSFLIAGLKGEADANHDRVVTAAELFVFVRNHLNANSNVQHAVMWGNFDKNMPLIRWR